MASLNTLTRRLAALSFVLSLALAALAGYTYGKQHGFEQLDQLDAAGPPTQLLTFYVAKDNDANSVPSRGDLASFFISTLVGFDGPWVIHLDCWGDRDKSALFLSTAASPSMNQPFYLLDSPTWPTGAGAYCEYSGTQADVEFGSGYFEVYPWKP